MGKNSRHPRTQQTLTPEAAQALAMKAENKKRLSAHSNKKRGHHFKKKVNNFLCVLIPSVGRFIQPASAR